MALLTCAGGHGADFDAIGAAGTTNRACGRKNMASSFLGHHDHTASDRDFKGIIRCDVALCLSLRSYSWPISKVRVSHFSRGWISMWYCDLLASRVYPGSCTATRTPRHKEAAHAAYTHLPLAPTPVPLRLHRAHLRHLPHHRHRLVPLAPPPLRHRADPVRRRRPSRAPQPIPPLLRQRRLVDRRPLRGAGPRGGRDLLPRGDDRGWASTTPSAASAA